MAYDPTKYDIELNGQGFRISNLVKRSAPDFSPRLNTGEEGQNDLDTLRIDGNTTFAGGMFQDKLIDKQRAATIVDSIINMYDKRVYTTGSVEGGVLSSLDYSAEVTAWCIYDENIYVACREHVAGVKKNRIFKFDQTSNCTALTLSTALQDAPAITSMIAPSDISGGYFLIATGSATAGGIAIRKHTGSGADTAWGISASPFATCNFMAMLRGQLYFVRENGGVYVYDAKNNKMQRVTVVGYMNLPTNMVEFNHRLWIGNADGLYVFDGVTAARFMATPSVLDDTSSYDNGSANFKYMAELNGWLYFNFEGYVYRTNSQTVEKFSEVHLPKISGITVVAGRVFVLTHAYSADDVVAQELDLITDPITSEDYIGFVWCYDEVGWSVVHSFTDSLYSDYTNINNQKPDAIYSLSVASGQANWLVVHFPANYPTSTAGEDFVIDFQEYGNLSRSSAGASRIMSSVIDNGYPNVVKYLDSVEIDYRNLAVDDYIKVSVSTMLDDGEWSAWQDNSVNISTTSPNPKRFFGVKYKKLRVKIEFYQDSAISGGALAIENATVHYAVIPEKRSAYSLSINCMGADTVTPMILKDGTTETATAKVLREAVYDAHASKYPVWLKLLDYGYLAADINNSALGTITITGGTQGFPEYGTIAIDNEFITYTSKTATTVTLGKRGAWGSTAASHTARAVVTPLNRVFVESIDEQFMLDPVTSNEYRVDNDYGTESIIHVECVEVNHEHQEVI